VAAVWRCRDFGESYFQEALDKIVAYRATSRLTWHFIGRLQANKGARPLRHLVTGVHSVDRLKIAERLSEQRPKLSMLTVDVCRQE